MPRPPLVLGYDMSTKLVAIGDSTGRTDCAAIPELDKGPDRLAAGYQITGDLTRRFVGRRTVVAAWIEWPAGRRVHPQSWQMFGVAQVAVARTLKEIYGVPVLTSWIVVDDWKRRAIGKGGVTKDEIAAWAVGEGLPMGLVQDRYDAFAVARAGRSMLGVAND